MRHSTARAGRRRLFSNRPQPESGRQAPSRPARITPAAAEPLESRVLLSGGPRVLGGPVRPGAEVYGDITQFNFLFDRAVKVPAPGALVLTHLENASRVFSYTQRQQYEGQYLGFVLALATPPLLPPGHYELRLRSGDGWVEGVDGADLDGELAHTAVAFPSGDGIAGGDLILPFKVTAYEGPGIGPKLLSAHAVSSSEIELQFIDDNVNSYGYVLERSDDGGPFVEIRRTRQQNDPLMSFIDATARPGVVYHYRVRFPRYVNDVPGYTPYSNVAVGTTLSPNLTVPVTGLTTTGGGRPDWLTAVGDTLFFTRSTGPHATSWRDAAGAELWKSDGTAAGTAPLYAGKAKDLIDFNGTLFFTGHDESAGFELWKSDGTPAGTVRVADVRPGPASSEPRMLGISGTTLYFAVHRTGQSYEVWKTDGTAAGTSPAGDQLAFLDEFPNSWRGYRRLVTASGGRLYFRRGDDAGGDTGQLWRTDGTPGGGERVEGIDQPEWLTEFKGQLFLAARTEVERGRGLFKLVERGEGAPPLGELVVRTETQWANGYLNYLTAAGDRLFYTGPGNHFSSDGTAAGTQMLGYNSTSGLRQYDFVDHGGVAYFFDNDYPPALWRSDGTAAGTAVVFPYDFTYTYPTHSPAFLQSAGGQLVYSDVRNLWYSDGTRIGTRKVAPLGAEALADGNQFGFAGRAAVAVGDKFFFSTKLADGSRELRVAALTPPSRPQELTVAPAAAAAGLRRAVVASTGNVLTWADRSTDETGFVVERSRSADFATLDRVYLHPANSTTATVPEAAPGATYFYRVRAVNAGGDSAYSNTAATPVVVGRYVFYNNSAFDGRSAAADARDDGAVASDKQALLAGQRAGAAHVTSYSRGINGVMLDVAGLWHQPTAADFEFRTGRSADASAWAAAPAPAVTFRAGAGSSGTDRLTLTWPDGAVRNTWLRVTLKANDRTGLPAADVFYFGNLVGDTANATTGAAVARVDALDLLATRAAHQGTTRRVGLTSRHDFNRDGAVNVFDLALTRSAYGQSLPLLSPEAVQPAGLAIPAARTRYRPPRMELLARG